MRISLVKLHIFKIWPHSYPIYLTSLSTTTPFPPPPPLLMPVLRSFLIANILQFFTTTDTRTYIANDSFGTIFTGVWDIFLTSSSTPITGWKAGRRVKRSMFRVNRFSKLWNRGTLDAKTFFPYKWTYEIGESGRAFLFPARPDSRGSTVASSDQVVDSPTDTVSSIDSDIDPSPWIYFQIICSFSFSEL